MEFIEIIILGILQGLTEFLPISSSGHLVLGQHLLKVASAGILMEVILHIGTLFSILVYYRKDINELLNGMIKNTHNAREYIYYLVISTIPAVIVGLFFDDLVESMFTISTVSILFIITGLVLYSTKSFKMKTGVTITLYVALLMGIAQMFAIMPGISRSGMTISMALFLGITHKDAAKFSFFMAIPILIGAGILQIKDLQILEIEKLNLLFVGFVSSFISGLIAIDILIKLLSKNHFWKFSLYCIPLGLSLMVWTR
jgi:undecaprenyl-diphosphatase